MNQQAKDKLTRARIDLITYQPFWGTLALRLNYVEDETIQTLNVDGKTVRYNPRFILALPLPETIAALAHEVGHCIFDHLSPNRRGGRNPVKWNFAGDYVINGMLKRNKFQIGKGWLFKEGWDDRVSTEFVYSQLPDPPPQDGKGSGGIQTDGSGEGQLDGHLSTPKDDPAVADDWKIAVAQAAIAAKQAGKLPAELERFIGELLHPAEDWRSALRKFMTDVSKSDFSWVKPHKYLTFTGVCLPTMHTDALNTLAVVIDDSGSIGNKILNVFGNETVSCRDAVRPLRTLLISCDARVNKVDDLDEYAPLAIKDIKVVGGGGTDFRPPFAWLEEQGIKPSCLLYLTDGYGPFPEVPPDFPVLWCMTTDVVPPWGERVQITVDD